MKTTSSISFKGQYPRSGDVALLCEGDISGYESSMIKAWCDTRTSLMVDVWPCGTENALFGMADAIGRTIGLVVVEDRDFRSNAEATRECKKKENDRRKRAVNIGVWKHWQRNEIENYFLDSEIYAPVFAEFYGSNENEVRTALTEVIVSLAPWQIVEAVVYEVRKCCSSDPSGILCNNLERKPKIDKNMICQPEIDSVERVFKKNWETYLDSAGKDVCEMDALSVYEEITKQWVSVDYNSPIWRNDWAGKEVLSWLRKLMACRYGWPPKDREIVDWSSMNNQKSGDLDRDIEKAMQPRLVNRFIDILSKGSGDQAVSVEWNELIDVIQNIK